jgi:hypothetical protein
LPSLLLFFSSSFAHLLIFPLPIVQIRCWFLPTCPTLHQARNQRSLLHCLFIVSSSSPIN